MDKSNKTYQKETEMNIEMEKNEKEGVTCQIDNSVNQTEISNETIVYQTLNNSIDLQVPLHILEPHYYQPTRCLG